MIVICALLGGFALSLGCALVVVRLLELWARQEVGSPSGSEAHVDGGRSGAKPTSREQIQAITGPRRLSSEAAQREN